MIAYVARQSKAVRACLDTLACPAFFVDGKNIQIDPHLCTGCMFCVQICKDIKAKKRSA